MRMPFLRRLHRNSGVDGDAVHADAVGIRLDLAHGQATVTVTGRVTVNSSPRLRSVLLDVLRRHAGPVVAIDLSGVSYLDMSGLATLLEALKAARQRSVRLRVLGMTGQSRTLAEIAELDKIFQAEASEVEFR